MTPGRTRRLVLLAVLVLLAGAAWIAKDHLLPETAPAVRGAEQARALGCWDCHGDAARAPSLFGGSTDPGELRARIRDVPEHPAGLPAHTLDDLAAWIALVQHDGLRTARATGATGEWRAVELLASRQCFGCHGELGQGGVANPGSLKGYVPGFFGRDYDLLTRGGDPDVLRQWIRDGVPHFFRSGIGRLRPALWFTERQQVKMPGYARSLRRDQVEALVAYLAVLRQFGPLDAEGIAAYRARLAEGRPGG